MRWFGAALLVALLPTGAVAQNAGAGACTRCGPAPTYPTWSCADGRHQGGRGPCVERQDGSCGWMRLVCPEDHPPKGSASTCTPAECGAAPMVSSWWCPGTKGSGGFGVCKRDREGRCGWVHRPCGAPAQLPGSGASHVPPPRPGAPAPAPTRSCANLPRTVEDLRTWPVVAVCQPGGGPVAAAMTRVRTLGDGTFIFSGRGGCFRGRYTRCFSK